MVHKIKSATQTQEKQLSVCLNLFYKLDSEWWVKWFVLDVVDAHDDEDHEPDS